MMSSPLHRGWSTGDLVTHYYNSLYFKLYVRFAPFALHFTWPDACYILRQRRTLCTFSVQTRSFGFNLQVISRSLRNSSKLHPNNPENCDPSRGRFHHVCSGKNVLCAMLQYDPRRDLDISTHNSDFSGRLLSLVVLGGDYLAVCRVLDVLVCFSPPLFHLLWINYDPALKTVLSRYAGDRAAYLVSCSAPRPASSWILDSSPFFPYN